MGMNFVIGRLKSTVLAEGESRCVSTGLAMGDGL